MFHVRRVKRNFAAQTKKKQIAMLKNILFFALFVLSSLSVMAVPAKRTPRIVTQPDGTQLSIILTGDENFHYYQTLDGVALAQRSDGGYCYAILDGEVLTAGTILAHNKNDRNDTEIQYISTNAAQPDLLANIASQRITKRNALRISRAASRLKKTPSKVGQTAGVTGERKGLVILVNFKNKSFRSNNTREAFDNLFNQTGYSSNGNFGSVHDYFYDQSYGKFNLAFDVIGPVTVSQNMSYYGGNTINGDDSNPAEMVYEACMLADAEVNFADYDWDDDGEVDQVYLIYAGYSEASGADDDCIWPHEWNLNSANIRLTLDGVKVNTYGCSSELYGTSGTKMDGIGTPCHEFSHCLGLPDLYDTSGSSDSNYGMDEWSLMDYGCYGGDGFCPVGYTSYERMVSGWLTPTVLNEATTITEMKAITDAEEAYIIYNDKYNDEYYLLENRQLSNWDKYAPNSGMLVIHVDYDATVWAQNAVNNTKNRQRCTVIAADNSYYGINAYGASDSYGDTYPGTSKNTELTNTSKPAAKLYRFNYDPEYPNDESKCKKLMSKPITEITEDVKTGDISFKFMGGSDTPSSIKSVTALSPKEIVNVFSTDGRLLRTTTYDNWHSNLPAGVYVLRTSDGTAIKKISL